MSVESLSLKGFTVFEDASFDFVQGVNVFIGANGTGKTHAMKAVYALLRSFEDPRTTVDTRAALRQKLAGVFRPDDDNVGRLVRRVRGHGNAEVDVRVGGANYRFALRQVASDPVHRMTRTRRSTPSSVFLPSREVLSLFEGFESLYRAREISVDETYADAIEALALPPLRGVRPGVLGAVARELEAAVSARVVRDGPRFYLKETTGAKIEAHLAAEGHRKIATILQLISNGSLRDRAVLFWDEPEANLNPILSELVVDAVHKLATAGVQVMLATHDYLIASRLSLLGESGEKDAPIRFFALKRARKGPAEVTTADRLPDIEDNLLIDAIRSHNRYQREVAAESVGT
jgi:energy-coupling factor transporter ATP-binding protein EcfA2